MRWTVRGGGGGGWQAARASRGAGVLWQRGNSLARVARLPPPKRVRRTGVVPTPKDTFTDLDATGNGRQMRLG
eukprot:362321-Chlamydomonas_euryale.AAC.6